MTDIDDVHLVFKTHLDVGFTDLARNVVAEYFTFLVPKALRIAEVLRQADRPERLVWTIGSWLIYEYLEKAGPAERARMEAAIAAGDIAWHGLPLRRLADPPAPRRSGGHRRRRRRQHRIGPGSAARQGSERIGRQSGRRGARRLGKLIVALRATTSGYRGEGERPMLRVELLKDASTDSAATRRCRVEQLVDTSGLDSEGSAT